MRRPASKIVSDAEAPSDQRSAGSENNLAIEDDHLGAVAGCELHTTLGSSPRWAATRAVAKAYGPDLRLAVLAGGAIAEAMRKVLDAEGAQPAGAGEPEPLREEL